MACATVFDAFKVATEYLGPELYRLASFNSPWLNLIRRGTFAANTGVDHTYFKLEKSEPTTDEVAWSAVTYTDGYNANTCNPTYNDVNVGFTSGTYSPVRRAWKGPVFCKDDAYFTHKPDEFISGYVQELANYVRMDMENHMQFEYAKKVPIYVAQTAFNTSYGPSSNFTAPASTSEITQQMLDHLAVRLIWNRATNPDSNGFVSFGPNGPLFSLLVGMEASQLLFTNNTDLRADLRYGDSSALMQRMGATSALKNFRHVPWLLPARFSHDGTKYVRVNTFTSSAATKGYKTAVNPNWISTSTAPYEAAIVLSPDVMESELIAPKATVGPLKFDPSNYMGDWQWVTGPDALSAADGDGCYDPLHKKGRHYAEFMHALKPGSNTDAGAIVFFKRCPNTYDTVTCS